VIVSFTAIRPQNEPVYRVVCEQLSAVTAETVWLSAGETGGRQRRPEHINLFAAECKEEVMNAASDSSQDATDVGSTLIAAY